MNAQELFTNDGKPVGVFYCQQCKLVHPDRDFVDRCCVCVHCGKVIEDRKKHFTGYHSDCWYAHDREQNLERLAKAELVEATDAAYVYSHEGWGQDGYIAVDEIEDVLSDAVGSLEDWPEFLFCCNRYEPTKLDVAHIVENFSDDLYEDAYDDVVVPESFVKAVEEFNEANKDLHSYTPDYSRKVKVGPPPEWLVEEIESEEA